MPEHAELLAKMRDEPEHQRKNDAEEDGCSQGEIDPHVFAAPSEVTGHAAQREAEARRKHERGADDDEYHAEVKDHFAELCHLRRNARLWWLEYKQRRMSFAAQT